MTRRSNISFLLLLFLFPFLLFIPTLGYPLLKQEEEVLLEQVIHHSFLSQFHHYRHFSYHPLPRLSLKIDSFFWENNLWGFRASNFLFHLLNGLLYFYLLRRFHLLPQVCCFFSLLYLIHPLQIEAILTLSGRSPLLGMFCFLSSITLLKNTQEKNFSPRSLCLFFVFQLFAGLSWEPFLVSPLLCLFLSSCSKKKFFIASTSAMVLSAIFHGGIAYQQKTFWAGWQGETWGSNLWTRIPAIAEQTLEFFFPSNLCFYYRVPLQPSKEALFFSILWLGGMLYFFWKSKVPFRGFWLACVLLPYGFTFAPFPQKFVKYDAFAMFPLIGAISLAGFYWTSSSKINKISQGVTLSLLSLISWNLTETWKDPLRAWTRASCSIKGGSSARYQLGLYYLEEGQKQVLLKSPQDRDFFSKAMQVFEQVLQDPKLDLETQFGCCLKLSLLWLHERNDAEALRYLQEAEKLAQQETRALFFKDKRYYVYQHQAQIYDRQGNSKLAQSYWKKLIQEHPQEIQPRFSLAISQNQFGSPQDAINTLVEILEIDPKYYLARLQMGKIHFNLKEYALAKQQFLRVLEHSLPPEDEKETLYNLALTYQTLREYTEEEACLRKVIALAPDLWLSQRDLARLEKKKGNLDEAIRLLVLALQNLESSQKIQVDSLQQIKQELSELYLVKGKLAGERDDYEKARLWIEKAIAIFPENGKAVYEAAFLEKRQGYLESAKEKLEHLLQQNPTYHEAHRELGYIALQQKKVAEAVLHFQHYLDRIPAEKTELRRHLEEIIWNYQQEQYFEKVRATLSVEASNSKSLTIEVEAIKKALEHHPPENLEVKRRLELWVARSEMQILLEQARQGIREKQWTFALESLAQLLQKDPQQWEAYLLQGMIWIEIQPNQRESIELTLTQSIRYQPEHPQAYYVLGTYYFDLGAQTSDAESSRVLLRDAQKWLVLCKMKDHQKFYASQIQIYLETIEEKLSSRQRKD